MIRKAKTPAAPVVPGRIVLTTEEAAAHLTTRGWHVRPSTLVKMRRGTLGPQFVRPNGRDVRYPADLLDDWLDRQFSQVRRSTAEEGHFRPGDAA